MTKAEAARRVRKLRAEINRYRYAYHVLDQSLLSDSALDSLKKELFDLETQFPDLITADSPTQRVGGAPLSRFRKVNREREGRARMNSLNDAFSRQDLEAWLERLENHLQSEGIPHGKFSFYCDPKMDGLAVELVYRKGILALGLTRGDGVTGGITSGRRGRSGCA